MGAALQGRLHTAGGHLCKDETRITQRRNSIPISYEVASRKLLICPHYTYYYTQMFSRFQVDIVHQISASFSFTWILFLCAIAVTNRRLLRRIALLLGRISLLLRGVALLGRIATLLLRGIALLLGRIAALLLRGIALLLGRILLLSVALLRGVVSLRLGGGWWRLSKNGWVFLLVADLVRHWRRRAPLRILLWKAWWEKKDQH